MFSWTICQVWQRQVWALNMRKQYVHSDTNLPDSVLTKVINTRSLWKAAKLTAKTLGSFPKQTWPATDCNFSSYLAAYSTEHPFKPTAFSLSMYSMCEGALAAFKGSHQVTRESEASPQHYEHEQLLPYKKCFYWCSHNEDKNNTRAEEGGGKLRHKYISQTERQIQSHNVPLLVSCVTTEMSEWICATGEKLQWKNDLRLKSIELIEEMTVLFSMF